MPIHTPVLKKEVLEYLDPKQNENFVDCTVGEGGHSFSILEKNGPEGKVLGIDLDPHQVENARMNTASFKDRIILKNDSYANIDEVLSRVDVGAVNGILMDLGMSSVQLEGLEKGFAFKFDQALDMRYDDRHNFLTAERIINEWPEERIAGMIENYGEEKYAQKIAKNIVEQRKRGRVRTTFQLIEIIKNSIPPKHLKGKIHFATRTFQALRIAVNDELGNLEHALPKAIDILAPGGRIAVISFHSLEDRIVKQFFAQEAKKGTIKILTKKPVEADRKEVAENPRSRSAKLRAAIKL